MSKDPVSAKSADSRTAAFDFTPNSFLKSLSACLRESMTPFISRNWEERYASRASIRRYSRARTDTERTKDVPTRNRQTAARAAKTGIRILTGLVRPWGTIRMVTGVRSRLRRILDRFMAGFLRDVCLPLSQ